MDDYGFNLLNLADNWIFDPFYKGILGDVGTKSNSNSLKVRFNHLEC